MERPLLALFLPLVESLDAHEISALWCPADLVGNKCPDPSWWSYYKCCGHLHKSCCSHLRLWVLILIIALPIFFLIPPITYLLRRLFCTSNTSHTPAQRVETRKDTAL